MLLWTLLLMSASTFAAPVNKIADLSYPYDDKVMYYPAISSRPKLYTKLVDTGPLPDGPGLSEYMICSAEHGGTHMDAPSHFGEESWELHQIPLDRLIGRPLVVVNITERALKIGNTTVQVSDLEEWEKQHGPVPEGAVVFMNSGWNRYWGNETAFLGNETPTVTTLYFPGFGLEVAKWLRARKIFGVGSDTVSIDVGTTTTNPAHTTLLPANIYALENVANMDKLPPAGAKVYIFPMKNTGGTGAPVRIIAEWTEI